MKYLTIIRHADAPFLNINQDDFDRNLSEKGFKQSKQAGQKLAKHDIEFDLMLSSSAIRAINTCQMIALELKYNIKEIKLINNLYYADRNGLSQIISNTKKDIKSLAIVAHNPAIHKICEEITKSKINNFTTCSLIHICLKIDSWNNWVSSDKKVLFTFKG